jgi:hypothetical protein
MDRTHYLRQVKPLEGKLRSVHGFILEFWITEKVSPNFEDIQGHLKCKSVVTARNYVRMLNAMTFINNRTRDGKGFEVLRDCDGHFVNTVISFPRL